MNPRDDFFDTPVRGVLLVFSLVGAGVSGPSGDEPVPEVGLAGVPGALGPVRFKEATSAAAFPGSGAQTARLEPLIVPLQGRHNPPNAQLTVPMCISRFRPVFHGSSPNFTVPGPNFTVKFGLPPAICSLVLARGF